MKLRLSFMKPARKEFKSKILKQKNVRSAQTNRKWAPFRLKLQCRLQKKKTDSAFSLLVIEETWTHDSSIRSSSPISFMMIDWKIRACYFSLRLKRTVTIKTLPLFEEPYIGFNEYNTSSRFTFSPYNKKKVCMELRVQTSSINSQKPNTAVHAYKHWIEFW